MNTKNYMISYKRLMMPIVLALTTGATNISPPLLLPIPEQLRKINAIPSKFPEKLETIKNPASYLVHQSLDYSARKSPFRIGKGTDAEPQKIKIRRRKYKPAIRSVSVSRI